MKDSQDKSRSQETICIPRGAGRRKGRTLAFQALFQWDLRGEDFAEELPRFLQAQCSDAEVRQFALALARGCREHLKEIDAQIVPVVEHWNLDRISTVDRNIIRLAVYEMIFRAEIPKKVSIAEAIKLAKRFGTAESGAFVNGVLDAVRRRLEGER